MDICAVGKLTILKNHMTPLPEQEEIKEDIKPTKSKGTKSHLSVNKVVRTNVSSKKLVFSCGSFDS